MSWVYFIRPIGMLGPVKIGYSSHPESRLLGLGCWSPFPLEVIATIPGDGKLERRFHTKFAHLHSHHEWFHAAPEIEAAIAAIKAGTFDAAAELPAKGRNLHKRKPHIYTLAERQGLGVRARLDRCFHKTGYRPAKWCGDRAAAFEALDPIMQELVRVAVIGFVADPLSHGKPYNAPWAKERAAAFRQLRKAA